MRFLSNIAMVFLVCRVTAAYSLSPDSARTDASSEIVTSRHTITIGGSPLRYTARVGFIPIREEATGAVHAQIFFVSYSIPPRRGEPARPLTFYTNGGPVEPATLSELGPRIMGIEQREGLSSPRHKMMDNPRTWLTATDVVLIDPVGTGFSHATKAAYASEFYNVDGDSESLAQFMQTYLRRFDPSMLQPIFVAGFSYGSFRSAFMAEIANRRGVALQGLILLSSVLGNAPRHTGFALPDSSYPQLIPSFTATAFAHGKLSPDLQADFDEAIRQSESWAANEYPKLLSQTDHPNADQLEAAAAQMARLTGLSAEVVLYNLFRFAPDAFLRDLLGPQWTPAGLFDSRIKAGDPAIFGLTSDLYAFLSNLYFRDELHFKTELRYEAGLKATLGWRCGDKGAIDCFGGPSALAALQRAMRKNPSLRVIVTNGYYDFAAPFFGSKLAIGQLDPDLQARVNVTCYRSGHFPPPDSRDDIARFIRLVSISRKH